jgi:hypothetical protein
MLDQILNGVDRALAYKLMLAHIIIAVSNYIVSLLVILPADGLVLNHLQKKLNNQGT